MKRDPNAACANAEQRLWWAVLHDAVAHPLMALTGYCALAVRFHDYTSRKAWPRSTNAVVAMSLDKLLVLKSGALDLFGPSAPVMARLQFSRPQTPAAPSRVVSFPPAKSSEALA